ncbi:MAG: DUF1592 domain-containing protein [Myxococcota bacterium]
MTSPRPRMTDRPPLFPALGAVAMLLLPPGCYSGVGDHHADSSPQGMSGGDPEGEDGEDDTGLPPPPEADCLGPDQPRRLNRIELNMVALDVFGVDSQPFDTLDTPGDATGAKVGFRLGVSEAWVDTYVKAAEVVATEYINREGLVTQCDALGASCARPTLEILANQMLRRPVDTPQMDSLVGIIQTSLDNDLTFEEGLVAAITALFLSPEFLYIGTHVGSEPGAYTLDDYEIATRLALALWNSVPDEQLRAAADAGELLHEEGIRAQVDRMLADPQKGSRFIETWASSYLGLSTLDYLAQTVPEGSDLSQQEWAALVDDMRQQALMTMQYAFEHGDEIETLVEADFVFLNERLAEHFGIEGVTGEEIHKVELPPGSPFGGLMTTGATLVQNKDLIHRGVSVLETFMCQTIAAPSDEGTLARVAEQLESASTEEELAEIRMNDAACAGCHNAIDPIGTAFTQFDKQGHFSEVDDNGQPIEIDIEYYGTPLHGPQDVRTLILEGDFVSCFAPTVLGPLSNREMRAYESTDVCATDDMLATIDGTVNLRSIVQASLVSGTFRHRMVDEPPQ